MILIDSIHINNGGGKVLLEYLISVCEENKLDIFYLFDERCLNSFKEIPHDRKQFLNASLLKRHRFYKTNKRRFTKILCFGNLPPTTKLQSKIFTYFHQRLFIIQPKELSIRQKILLKLKALVFKSLLRNTDFIILQTENIREEFVTKFKAIHLNKTKVIPFYENITYPQCIKKKNSFIYISGGSEHKNHEILLNAFTRFYDKYKKGELILTVEDSFSYLINKIENLINMKYPIINLKYVHKESLASIYSSSEYCVFPSLSESLGLGILEAIEADCKIIGSDLPYMYGVCEPSLKFDPLDENSLFEAFCKTQTEQIKPSTQKAFNEIDKLINLLK